ncbi:MAG: hypothetical protein ER33_00635 [Cyanobium sp. CACIAM 14]|nr:MAG: hypothetical protein ER33_00635 [Cyanobium sp. CACIAM 14]
MDSDRFLRPAEADTLRAAVLVVGGSTAAYSATLAALQAGAAVLLVQPTQLVGGQYTAQALPASDDPPERAPKRLQSATQLDPAQLDDGDLFCGSALLRAFRRRQLQLQPVGGQVIGNPGAGWVSHFAVRPDTALRALEEPLLPHLASGRLRIVPFAAPEAVEFDAASPPRLTAVRFHDLERNLRFRVEAEVVLEATDLGDLLEVGGIASRVGQEARADTGEAVLPDQAVPLCQQAFTFGIVVERATPAPAECLPAPEGYGRDPWLQPADFPCSFWVHGSGGWQERPFFDPNGMFRYRRLACAVPDEQVRPGDVTVLNWGTSPLGAAGPLGCGNDYRFGCLSGVSREERRRHLERARARAQAYLHCLQSAHGLALRPRGDLTWTADGIALEPYIREARRGVALTTIRHEDVARRFFPGRARARSFADSVGIGAYHYLDFHPNLTPGHVDLGADGKESLPFTVPLGALIPVATDGLILSAKSIGTTHITNAAYRMHPVEWAIGEAGGRLAAFALAQGVSPRQVACDPALLRRFQTVLTGAGAPIHWFNDVGHDDPDFSPIQVLAAAGLVAGEDRARLRFNPEGGVNRAVAAAALVGVLGWPVQRPAQARFSDVPPSHWAFAAVETLAARGVTSGVGGGRFGAGDPLRRDHFAQLLRRAVPAADAALVETAFSRTSQDSQPLRRRELSRVLHGLWLGLPAGA